MRKGVDAEAMSRFSIMRQTGRSKRNAYHTTAPQYPPVIHRCFPPSARSKARLKYLLKRLENFWTSDPIWTRRGILNTLRNVEGLYSAKYAYQYVGYMFRSGPWREAVIKYGVDPRLDPKYRIYQTMFFQLENEGAQSANKTSRRSWNVRGGEKRANIPHSLEGGSLLVSHIFDGRQLILDGKVWCVCDITDPFIQSILSTTNLRRKCHVCCPSLSGAAIMLICVVGESGWMVSEWHVGQGSCHNPSQDGGLSVRRCLWKQF